MSEISHAATTAAAKKEISEMSEFIALYYARWFLQASMTTCSPRFDLEAIWDMKKYSAVRCQLAEKCLKSMKHHTWYLHGSIIPFCLADPEVKEDEKREVAEKIHDILHDPSINEEEAADAFKYRKKDLSETFNLESKPNLSKFVDRSSRIVFDILDLEKSDLDWLQLPPSLWHLMTPYKKFQYFISKLPVVNDAAERNVKLIQDFVGTSCDESLRQDILLAVESKRKAGRPHGTVKKRKRCKGI